MYFTIDAIDVLVTVNDRGINLIKNAVVVDTTFLVKLIARLKVTVEMLVATNVISSFAICAIEAVLFTAVAVKVLNKVNNLDIVTFEDTAELKVRKKDFLTIPEKDAEEKGLLPNIRLLELQHQQAQ